MSTKHAPQVTQDEKLEIVFCIDVGKGWTNLHLYCPKTKGYSSQGGKTKDDIIHLLLQWPIERNASYFRKSVKEFKKISGMVEL